MGLDSYLYRTSYESGHKKGDRYQRLLKVLDATKVVSDEGAIIVRVTVAYWRKANQIHKWFVDKCQGGVDDCRYAEISRKTLVELRDLCQSLIAEKDADRADEKLPPQAGFFFGSTEVDDYYWEDLELTLKQLNRVLEHTPEDWSGWFEYHAS